MTHGKLALPPAVLAFGAFMAAVPLATMHFLGRQEVHVDSSVHFLGVGLSAAFATAASLALTVVGARRGDGRTVLLGTAFSVMAALLAVHGIATPGWLVGMNGVVAFSGGATLPLGGAVLALSALPVLRRPSSVRPLVVLQLVLVTGVVVLGTAGMIFPSLVPSVPEPMSALALAALGIGLAFYVLLAWRALRTFLLTRRWADLSVAVGLVWLSAALFGALTLGWWNLGWWLGHGFELVGLVFVGVPVAYDLHRSAASRPLSGDLAAAELVRSEEAFLGARVRTLTRLLAERDTYTEEHTRRVALRAVQVGEVLGLSRGRLRELAVGGLLHDIGKLSVPDTILGKPGPLTDDEYDVIKTHPARGFELLSELGGFSETVHRLVLDHHERLDGSGYPRGLQEEGLDLETRILAVCDVFDALISNRVYRDAWTTERALDLLREQSRTSFDGRCVAALERVLADAESVAEPSQRAAMPRVAAARAR